MPCWGRRGQSRLRQASSFCILGRWLTGNQDLTELRFMRAFLQEVLRLYPTVPVMIRQVYATHCIGSLRLSG
jgi:cytochrome P450